MGWYFLFMLAKMELTACNKVNLLRKKVKNVRQRNGNKVIR